MPNWSTIFQTFSLHSSVSALENQSKNLNFKSFFTSRRPFGGYFQWNACTFFRKTYSWTRYSDAKLIKDILKFLFHSSVFVLEKLLKNLNVESFFASTRPFGGYIQWNACTYFQKIRTWTRYSDAKFIKDISNF